MKEAIFNFIRSKPEGQYVQVHQLIKAGIVANKEEALPHLDLLVMEGMITHHNARTIGSKHAWFWGHHGPKVSAAVALPRSLPYRWDNEKAIHDAMFKGMKIAMLARGL